MKRLIYVTALALFAAVISRFTAAQASAAMSAHVSQAEINEWLHSTPRIRLTRGRLPAGSAATVASLDGTTVSGFVSRPDGALDGLLSNGQEVMVLPLVSGGSGGVFYAFLFTRINGVVTFVTALHSNGHLFTFLLDGALHIETPIYGINDAQCCPSRHDYRIITLHRIQIIVLKHWIAP